MSNCWKSHAAAYFILSYFFIYILHKACERYWVQVNIGCDLHVQQHMQDILLGNLEIITLKFEFRPQGYKTIFMLNSTEHEISTDHKN